MMIVYTNVETEEEIRLPYEISRYEHSKLWERSEEATPAVSAPDAERVSPNALKAITVAQLDEIIESLGLDVDLAEKKPAKVVGILEALLAIEPTGDGGDGGDDGDDSDTDDQGDGTGDGTDTDDQGDGTGDGED